MLSKLFNSARNIFTPTPQTNTNEEPVKETTNTEMVTTRGQTGKHASQEEISGEDSIVVDTPRSSRKRSRKATQRENLEVADEEVISTPAKKQKILPLREKDEDGPKNTRVVVEIPVSSIPLEFREMKDAESTEQESAAEEEAEEEAVRLEISDSESDGGSEAEEPTKPAVSSAKNNITAAAAASPIKSGSTPMSVKPKHKRFGSEDPEPEPEFFSTAAEIIESDEESSDDDAPEVIGAQDALKSAQWKARDAAKAVEEQETAIRKKRKERDAMLKKQAETATKKRNREEEKALAKETKLDVEGGREIDSEFQDGRVTADTSSAEVKATPASLTSRSNIPDLLPDEYLQDDSESEEPEDSETEVVRTKPKKLKFAELVERKPKDRRKGSTTYRVTEVRNKNLAPKSAFHAKSTKEAWLKGRAGKGPGGIRKVASGGFFKKK